MAKLVNRVCPACGKTKNFRSDNKTCGCNGTNPFRGVLTKTITPENAVDIELQKLRDKRESKETEVKILRERVIELEKENAIFLELQNMKPAPFDIMPRAAQKKSESVAVAVASDWHAEERVRREQVSNKNEYTLDIFRQRVSNWLQGLIAWYKIESRDTEILTIVLALLGDFITGSIHEDLAEGNQLPPAEAIHLVFSVLAESIKFLLANTPKNVQFVIPCHSGNHGRMTKEQRIATESGNSLEYFMYLMLRDYFDSEKRVSFIVQPGYHAYVRFFEGAYEVRFHHGHQINYQGGVGGITIPVNKAIGQWNKAHPVDLDVFGHFHTRFDGGNFICNGSLIGYNAYAVSIKASYEPPSQTFFLVNREYAAKTMVAPIFVD